MGGVHAPSLADGHAFLEPDASATNVTADAPSAAYVFERYEVRGDE